MRRDFEEVLKGLRGFLMNEAENVASIAMSLQAAAAKEEERRS
ncbi:MAG TPA: hypothetical protein VGG06_34575 [Thermoanaerobaculia bacterium]|jgi:hypothetical protein